ncbi:hypothetical protein V6N13_040325 [Hibiscus sabdariffa]
MGGVGRGKQLEGNIQAGPRGGGRGQQGSVAQIRPRGPKRGLQGKYEVCTPVGSKKARSASSILVIEEDGNLEDPAVIFVCESRLKKNKVENIRRRLGMVGNLVVEKSDDCVGLFMLWNDSVNVRLLSYLNSHIDVEVEGGEIPVRFTGMYGTSDRRRKHEDWELLDSLKSRSDLP